MLFNEINFGIYILILASFIGFEIISKVPTMLHTPLMSGSNAISGIILLGALMIAPEAHSFLEKLFVYSAIVLATINVVGGFVVTDRMLSMFRAKKVGDKK